MLRYEDLTDVVLVGWSYGGMVVAGVADRVPERIAQVVYLDSDVPQRRRHERPAEPPRRAGGAGPRPGDGWRVPPAISVDEARRSLPGRPG